MSVSWSCSYIRQKFTKTGMSMNGTHEAYDKKTVLGQEREKVTCTIWNISIFQLQIHLGIQPFLLLFFFKTYFILGLVDGNNRCRVSSSFSIWLKKNATKRRYKEYYFRKVKQEKQKKYGTLKYISSCATVLFV